MLPKMHKITQNSLLKKHGIFCLTFSLRGDLKESLDKRTKRRYNIYVFRIIAPHGKQHSFINGPVAQLGERSVRIREVESSSLFRSTIKLNQKRYQREKPRSFNDFRAFLRPFLEA